MCDIESINRDDDRDDDDDDENFSNASNIQMTSIISW